MILPKNSGSYTGKILVKSPGRYSCKIPMKNSSMNPGVFQFKRYFKWSRWFSCFRVVPGDLTIVQELSRGFKCVSGAARGFKRFSKVLKGNTWDKERLNSFRSIAGMFQGISGVFQGVSRVFWSVDEDLRGIPGFSKTFTWVFKGF